MENELQQNQIECDSLRLKVTKLEGRLTQYRKAFKVVLVCFGLSCFLQAQQELGDTLKRRLLHSSEVTPTPLEEDSGERILQSSARWSGSVDEFSSSFSDFQKRRIYQEGSGVDAEFNTPKPI